MLSQYTAVAKFITNTIKATPMDAATLLGLQTAQLEQMKSALTRVDFNIEEAAALQDELAKPTVAFTAAQREDLASAVSRLSTHGRVAAMTPKAKLQDGVGFPDMLTDEQWDELESLPDIGSRLSACVRIMLQFGLRNPSEPTKRRILIMLSMIGGGAPLSASEFYQWLQRFTDVIGRKRKNPVFPTSIMVKYPENGAQLKFTHPHLYPRGDPVASRIQQVEIERRINLYGTRSTMKELRPTRVEPACSGSPVGGSNMPQELMQAMMMQLGRMFNNNQQSSEPTIPLVMSGTMNRSRVNRERLALSPSDNVSMPMQGEDAIGREQLMLTAPDYASRPVQGVDANESERPQSTADSSGAVVADGAASGDVPPSSALTGLAKVRQELKAALLEKEQDKAKKKNRGGKTAKAKSKASAKKKANADAKVKVTASASATSRKGKLILGCSKCRYVTTGCSTCKDPSFTGKRGKM